MKFHLLFLASVTLIFCQGCKTSNSASSVKNPPAPGFNLSSSDAKAITIADNVMEAMGGRKAWDKTRYLSWSFFSRRRLLWDRHTGDVRIEFTTRPLAILVNVHSGKGKLQMDGKEVTQPDSLAKYLERGKRIWINDSYWLVMPFKLKDSGVTLKFVGEEKLPGGEETDVLQLTFENVGVTPQNKYHVWVDKKTNLICQWAYFEKAENEKPDFSNAWKDYNRHGQILLSGDRGKGEAEGMSQIAVFKKVSSSAFTSFEKFEGVE